MNQSLVKNLEEKFVWAFDKLYANNSEMINLDYNLKAFKFYEIYEQFKAASLPYHNFNHVDYVINKADEIINKLQVNDEYKAVVYMAAFYHDLGYNPETSHNEIRATIDFINDMPGISSNDLIIQAILETTPGVPAKSFCGQILSDADLAILNEDPKTYDNYVQNVRKEYSFVDDQAWAFGRPAVLNSLGSEKLFFFTDDKQAKANISRELKLYLP